MVRKRITALALVISMVLMMFLNSIVWADSQAASPTGATSPNWQMFESSYASDKHLLTSRPTF